MVDLAEVKEQDWKISTTQGHGRMFHIVIVSTSHAQERDRNNNSTSDYTFVSNFIRSQQLGRIKVVGHCDVGSGICEIPKKW